MTVYWPGATAALDALPVTMNWKWKACLQFGLSLLPRGEEANYFLQRYVTKSLPISDIGFADHVHYARKHVAAISRHYAGDLDNATFYEFGAGWDLIIPIGFYGLGIKRQILVDVRNLIRPEVIDDTIARYAEAAGRFGLKRIPDRQVRNFAGSCAEFLRQCYGIVYKAPCDATQTGLESESIDCITSTSTLEHIPAGDLSDILRECHRIVRPHGIVSFVVDYSDHYSYFDNKISPYNYLRYSDRAWAVFNPPLHYQNRLRHPDYLRLLTSAGFEVIEEERHGGSAADLRAIEQLRVQPRFKRYAPADLAVGTALIVARKSRNGPGQSLPSRPLGT